MTRQSGVTLVEMLVAIALGSAVALLITNMYITSSRTYTDQNRIIDAQRSGRITLEILSRDLRHSGLDPLRTANAGFEVAEADRVRVTMDLNLDGDVADSGEQITFRRLGNVLQKGTGAAGAERWKTLAENVSIFRVDYFGESNATIAAPVAVDQLAGIRALIVTLTIRDNKVSGDSFERTYSTGIACRNMFR